MNKIKHLLKYKISFLFLIIITGCCTFSGPNYKGEKSPHFNGENFYNAEGNMELDFLDVLKWNLFRKSPDWIKYPKEIQNEKPPDKVTGPNLRVTFINHATILLQFDGINVITDPVWAELASPVSFYGPIRYRQPGIKIEDLPPIDMVLLSHNHYDHLDFDAVKYINNRFKPLFLVSLGNKELFVSLGIENIIEMDWWQEHQFNQVNKVTFVPARHFAMRGICDQNTTLWGGFVISSSGGPIYYTGDTGYGIHFKQIKEKFSHFRFSMIPIAPINPEWIMKYVHLSPEEAVKVHKEINSSVSMAFHFGTFKQGDDEQYEAVSRLKKAIIKENISPKEFRVLRQGGHCEIPPLSEFAKIE